MHRKYTLNPISASEAELLGLPYPLYQIQAARDITLRGENGEFVRTLVKKGDLGGYVQSEKNLSQDGTCWLHRNAASVEQACIEDDVQLINTHVKGSAYLQDRCVVIGIKEQALIADDAHLSGAACIEGRAIRIEGSSHITGDVAIQCDYVELKDNARINTLGKVILVNAAALSLKDNAQLLGSATIQGENTRVSIEQSGIVHSALLTGTCLIGGHAYVSSQMRDQQVVDRKPNTLVATLCKTTYARLKTGNVIDVIVETDHALYTKDELIALINEKALGNPFDENDPLGQAFGLEGEVVDDPDYALNAQDGEQHQAQWSIHPNNDLLTQSLWLEVVQKTEAGPRLMQRAKAQHDFSSPTM